MKENVFHFKKVENTFNKEFENESGIILYYSYIYIYKRKTIMH
jgi:hypothetical protein